MYAVITDEMLDDLSDLDREARCDIIVAYINYQLYGTIPEYSSNGGYGYGISDLCHLAVISKKKELDDLYEKFNSNADAK